MATKISFVSLGCDKNLIDSEIMLGLIDEKGYIITPNDSEADVIIINSCGFILDANQEAIDKVLEMADYKANGNCKALIVTGCMAQRYKDEIFESLPEVDAVVGTGDFENVGAVIDRLLNGEKKVQLVTDINHLLNENNSYKSMVTTTGGLSYLKIAEGCDNRCTYCTIPSLRGKYRSRNIESLVKEAEILADKGVRELILIAQDTSLYGKDLYGEQKLHVLLQEISKIEDIKWIRILYCYPENVYDELIDEMASNPKVLHYLDMPVQHTNDRILKLMGRRSVFTYSPEEGTPACRMDGQIDEEIKAQRKESIMEAQMEISAELGQKFVGKTLEVIVEGKIEDEDDLYCGRSFRDCYEIDGFVFFKSSEELIAGDFYNIKITSAGDYDLIGERVE